MSYCTDHTTARNEVRAIFESRLTAEGYRRKAMSEYELRVEPPFKMNMWLEVLGVRGLISFNSNLQINWPALHRASKLFFRFGVGGRGLDFDMFGSTVERYLLIYEGKVTWDQVCDEMVDWIRRYDHKTLEALFNECTTFDSKSTVHYFANGLAAGLLEPYTDERYTVPINRKLLKRLANDWCETEEKLLEFRAFFRDLHREHGQLASYVEVDCALKATLRKQASKK